jgi:hypothetical protein
MVLILTGVATNFGRLSFEQQPVRTTMPPLYQDIAIAAAAADQDILRLLPLSFEHGPKNELAKLLLSISPALSQPDGKTDPNTVLQVFLAWCSNSSAVPPEVHSAVQSRRASATRHRLKKRRLIARANLNSKRPIGGAGSCEVPTEVVNEPARPYPPPGFWLFESEAIRKKWKYALEEGKQADSRKPRMPMLRLDMKKIHHNVRFDESKIYTNSSGEVIAIIIRDFCPHAGLVSWGDDAVKESVPLHRSCRVSVPFNCLV